MVLRQCVACNSKVPGSKKACVCGHVFTEAKMIGRKRYSGYRAMLCSRNSPGKKTQNKSTAPRLMLRESKRPSKRRSRSPKPKRKELMGSDGSMAKATQRMKSPHHYVDFNSPEFLEKLEDALGDINKKLAKQSLLWMILKSSKC